MAVAELQDNCLRWWCDGCEDFHLVPVNVDVREAGAPDGWDYPRGRFVDEALEGEALTADSNKRITPRCHTFIRQGHIEYLTDCDHSLAGKTIPMHVME